MYARLGKPYKFYMMFHGEHGCAKTSVIKAIASLTGKHVVVLRLDRFKDVIEMCRTITKFSSQVDRLQGLYVCSGGSTVSTMTIKRSDTRDAEKDVETASIEHLSSWSTLKRRQKPRKNMKPRSLLWNLAKHFRRSAGTSRMYGSLPTNQKISIQLS
jgi:hypothetical protein